MESTMTAYKATPEQWDALEKCSHAWPGVFGPCILELRARVEQLEDANSKPTPNPSQIRSSLVERVAKEMKWSEFPMVDARAALVQSEPQGPKLIYRYSPATIAECGGPCEQGPQYCDCGQIKGEPEPQGPTQKEAVALYSEVMAVNNCQTLGEMAEHFARAVLTRWGRPAVEPVPVSERPWEREGWCDTDGQCWMGDAGGRGFVPSWRLCKPSDSCLAWSLPHWALPVPRSTTTKA